MSEWIEAQMKKKSIERNLFLEIYRNMDLGTVRWIHSVSRDPRIMAYIFIFLFLLSFPIQHLRCQKALVGVRWATIQPATGTVIYGTKRHCITTVDWLSVHLSHGSDLELHLGCARAPMWWRHQFAGACWPLALFITHYPGHTKRTRSVGQS